MNRGRLPPPPSEAGTAGGQILLRVLEQQQVTLTEFAALAGLSTSALCRAIRADPGHHTIRFAEWVRRAAARKLSVDMPLVQWLNPPLSNAKVASLFPKRRRVASPGDNLFAHLGSSGAQRLRAYLRGTGTSLEALGERIPFGPDDIRRFLAASPGTQPIRFVQSVYVETGTYVVHSSWLTEPGERMPEYRER